MFRSAFHVIILSVILLSIGTLIGLSAVTATGFSADRGSVKSINESNDSSLVSNRVHRIGNVWMNITNRGFLGNQSSDHQGSMEDPEYPGTWAPQCEFPAESGVQYLFQAGLWVGALIQKEDHEYPRVSVGVDGWVAPAIKEFTAAPNSGITERSNVEGAQDYLGNDIYSPEAVAPQEFLSAFLDTLSNPDSVGIDPVDSLHRPLGIRISQKSVVWDEEDITDFIIIEWEIENISQLYLKNLYIGLFVDGDVGESDERERHIDDLCGFHQWRYFEGPDDELDSTEINLAYIADNDGRPSSVGEGNDFTAPGVSGVMILDSPNPRLTTSFNWWVSNGVPELDFGPSWEDDNAVDDWTVQFGTPMGDARKYFLMSNRERDYDMVFSSDSDYIESHPQVFRDINGEILESHNWRIPEQDFVGSLADGSDARYLLSWGPLGIFDHIDGGGNRIYRLNPGEKFSITIAYICAEGFHDRDNPQPDLENIDPDLFDFTDLYYNAGRARYAFDQYLLSIGNKPPASVPRSILLTSIYPNPFNSTTTITYELPTSTDVSLNIFNVAGREVTTLVRGRMEAGRHQIVWNGAGVPSGIYICRLTVGEYAGHQKLALVR